jgi:hypothetical protein
MFEKGSKKKRNYPQDPPSGFLIHPFDFSTPLPVDVCVARLKIWPAKDISALNPITCEVKPVAQKRKVQPSEQHPTSGESNRETPSSEVFQFVVRKGGGEVAGSLYQVGEHSTAVTGHSRIMRSFLVGGAMVIVMQSAFWICLLIAGIPVCVLLVPLELLLGSVFWAFYENSRKKLVQTVFNVFLGE